MDKKATDWHINKTDRKQRQAVEMLREEECYQSSIISQSNGTKQNGHVDRSALKMNKKNRITKKSITSLQSFINQMEDCYQVSILHQSNGMERNGYVDKVH